MKFSHIYANHQPGEPNHARPFAPQFRSTPPSGTSPRPKRAAGGRRARAAGADPLRDVFCRAGDTVSLHRAPIAMINACGVTLRSNRERCSHSLRPATRQENCRHHELRKSSAVASRSTVSAGPGCWANASSTGLAPQSRLRLSRTLHHHRVILYSLLSRELHANHAYEVWRRPKFVQDGQPLISDAGASPFEVVIVTTEISSTI